jgi:hypothetical protein
MVVPLSKFHYLLRREERLLYQFAPTMQEVWTLIRLD